jgi:DNA-binding MarR family transcriptional regulator
MTQVNTLLKELGLTPNQTYIYLHLAKRGKAKAGEIIKATGFHRNIVYGTLEELIEKRLVGSSKENGVLVYRIFDPERLVAEQEERVRKAKDLVGELAKYTKGGSPQQIVIYEGQKDFVTQARRAYEIMSPGGTARTLGISPKWHELVGNEIGEELLELHMKKKIHWKALAKRITKEDKKYIDATKGLMEGKESQLVADDTTGIEILEDRISIRSFVEPYVIVEIINEQLAKNYQRYFDFLWEMTP